MSFGVFGLAMYTYYLLLAVGIPIFIIWFAVSYLQSAKERNKLLRELVDKIER